MSIFLSLYDLNYVLLSTKTMTHSLIYFLNSIFYTADIAYSKKTNQSQYGYLNQYAKYFCRHVYTTIKSMTMYYVITQQL